MGARNAGDLRDDDFKMYSRCGNMQRHFGGRINFLRNEYTRGVRHYGVAR